MDNNELNRRHPRGIEDENDDYPGKYKHLLCFIVLFYSMSIFKMIYLCFLIAIIYNPKVFLVYVIRFIRYLINDIHAYKRLFDHYDITNQIQTFYQYVKHDILLFHE